jgi:hypothetical protein
MDRRNIPQAEDIGQTPIVLRIVDVAKGKWDKLDLTFNDGSKLSLRAYASTSSPHASFDGSDE